MDTPWVKGLNGAAQYLGIGLSTAKRDWASWEKHGVVAYRYGRDLRFKKHQLDLVPQPVNKERI